LIHLPEDSFTRLVQLPLCQHLTHLGSSLAFTEGQAAVLRTAGLDPVLVQHPHWPHDLPPAILCRGATVQPRFPSPRPGASACS